MTAPLAAGAATVALAAVLFFQQAPERYVIDEAEFPLVARAVAETGRPVYYRGEDLPQNVGIWHPPLYIYTLAAWQQLFGFSHTASRSYGFACALVAAFLGWLILRRLFPDRMPWLGVAWLAIYLLHPYVIQSALLPDIDSTVLVPASMLVLWAATETASARWPPRRAGGILGGGLGLAFLAKLTTPIALCVVAVVALALGVRRVRATVEASLFAFATAVVVFLIGWGGLSLAANLDFTYPFTFTLDSLQSKSTDASLLDRLTSVLPAKIVVYWLGLLFLPLVTLGAAVAVAAARRHEARMVLLFALFGGLVFSTYNVVTGAPFGFPKYYAPAMPALALVAVAPAALLPGVASRRWKFPVHGAVLLMVVAGAVWAWSVALGRRSTVDILPEPDPKLALVGAVVACAVLTFLFAPQRLLGWALLGWSAFALTATTAQLATSLRDRSADTSVRYFRGEHDFDVTVEKLRLLAANAGAGGGARVISAKDIGYESGARYYEDAILFADPQRLGRLIRSRDMLIVTRAHFDYSETAWPHAFATIRKLAHPIWVSPHGDFTIWRRTTRRER